MSRTPRPARVDIWTDEQVVAAGRAGTTVDEISERGRRSTITIAKILDAAGIPRGERRKRSGFGWRLANDQRTEQAANRDLPRIEWALELCGKDCPRHLAVAGRLRLDHPDASLSELADLHVPPLTKDVLRSRLRQLIVRAERVHAGRAVRAYAFVRRAKPAYERVLPPDELARLRRLVGIAQ
jgi:hypothetical protein